MRPHHRRSWGAPPQSGLSPELRSGVSIAFASRLRVRVPTARQFAADRTPLSRSRARSSAYLCAPLVPLASRPSVPADGVASPRVSHRAPLVPTHRVAAGTGVGVSPVRLRGRRDTRRCGSPATYLPPYTWAAIVPHRRSNDGAGDNRRGGDGGAGGGGGCGG